MDPSFLKRGWGDFSWLILRLLKTVNCQTSYFIMSSENNSLSYDGLIKAKTRLLRINTTLTENLFWGTLMRIVFYKPLTLNWEKPVGPYSADL